MSAVWHVKRLLRVRLTAPPSWLLTAVLLAGCVLAPYGLPSFYVHLFALALAYGTWAMSFGLVMGQLGLVSFGHAALFGGGAYAAAWVALHASDSLVAGLAAACMSGAVLGGVMGMALGRLSGVAFAIGSLAFGGMVGQIANGWSTVTGGSDGLAGVPFPRAFGVELNDRALYWIALALAAATVIVLAALLRRRPGLVLHAVRDNATRASSSGINVYAVRIVTLLASGALAGLSGGLSAYMVGSVSPSAVNWSASGAVLIMAVLGGVRNVTGPLIGAVAYTLLEQVLSQFFPEYQLILGFVFIAVVLVAPQGIGVRCGAR